MNDPVHPARATARRASLLSLGLLLSSCQPGLDGAVFGVDGGSLGADSLESDGASPDHLLEDTEGPDSTSEVDAASADDVAFATDANGPDAGDGDASSSDGPLPALTWEPMTLPETVGLTFTAVTGSSHRRVFTATEVGEILEFDGTSWRVLARDPLQGEVASLYLAGNDLFIGMRQPARMLALDVRNPNGWLGFQTPNDADAIPCIFPAPPAVSLSEVWACLQDDVAWMGIYRVDSSLNPVWGPYSHRPHIRKAWASNEEILLGGDSASVVRIDPSGAFSEEPVRHGWEEGELLVNGIVGFARAEWNRAYAVTSKFVLLRRELGAWTIVEEPIHPGRAYAMAGCGGEFYAGGGNGDPHHEAMMRWDGHEWREVSVRPWTLLGLWCSGPDDYFAVGDGVILRGRR